MNAGPQRSAFLAPVSTSVFHRASFDFNLFSSTPLVHESPRPQAPGHTRSCLCVHHQVFTVVFDSRSFCSCCCCELLPCCLPPFPVPPPTHSKQRTQHTDTAFSLFSTHYALRCADAMLPSLRLSGACAVDVAVLLTVSYPQLPTHILPKAVVRAPTESYSGRCTCVLLSSFSPLCSGNIPVSKCHCSVAFTAFVSSGLSCPRQHRSLAPLPLRSTRTNRVSARMGPKLHQQITNTRKAQ